MQPSRIAQRVDAHQVRPLRHRVLREGRPFESCFFDRDTDPDVWHMALVGNVDATVEAVLTLIPDGAGVFQLRGMAVAPEQHGRGLGSMLLQQSLKQLLWTHPEAKVWCHARRNAVSFYQKNGFISEGIAYEISPFGWHEKMYYQATPQNS